MTDEKVADNALAATSSRNGSETVETAPVAVPVAVPIADPEEIRSGGSGDRSRSASEHDKSKDSTGKSSKIKSFRQKTWMMMAASQVFLIALIVTELVLLSVFVTRSKAQMAQSNVKLLEKLFDSRTEDIIKILEITAENAQVEQVLINETGSSVEGELRQAASQLHLEYFAVINLSNLAIAAVPGTLVGTQFDPANLVSTILSSSTPSIVSKNAVITGSELLLNDIVTWRDTNIDGFILNHPADSLVLSDPALLRYVAVPVKNSFQDLLGVLVAGDIITGKHLIAQKTLNELGAGFVLIVHKTNEAGSSWKISQSVLATGFGTFDVGFEAVDSSFFDQVVGSFPNPKVQQGVQVGAVKFAVSGKAIPVDSGSAVLVVGFPQEEIDSMFTDVIISTLLFTFACIIVDLIAVFSAIRSFIDPLERLITIIGGKNYKKVDEALNNVKSSKKFIYALGLFAVASTALLSGMFIQNSKLLHQIFLTEGALGTQLRFLQNEYYVKIEEMITYASSVSVSDNMSMLFKTPTQSLKNDLQNDLEDALSVFKIELAFVVDVNSTVVASARAQNLGQKFNRLQVEMSDVLRNKRGKQFTAYISHEEYISFAPPEWKDESLASSSLHPAQANRNVVVRFVLSPIFDSIDGETLHGVLVYGDILNGKGFELSRQGVEFFNEGYVGVYWLNPESNSVELLSSYMQSSKNSYDLEIESASALSQLSYQREAILENGVTIGNEDDFSVAVERIDPGLDFDVESDSRIRSAKHDDLIFLVRGTKYAQFRSMEQSQIALGISSIILNAVFAVGIGLYTFVPVYKFTVHIKHQLSSKVKPSALPGSVAGAKSKFASAFKSFGGSKSSHHSSRGEL